MARERPVLFRARPDRGSVTLVSLCLLTTLGIALATYLALTSRSAQLSKRIANQDQAQQLAQIGLEEALWALNQNNWTSSGPDGNTTWSTSGASRTVTLSYPLSDQNATGRVNLIIANYASTGPTWPTVTATATVTLPSGQTFAKTVQATTGPAPLFGNAIASSESYVSFVQGGLVDSWNSDPDNDPSTAAVPYPATSPTPGNPENYKAVIAGKGDGTYGVVLTQAEVHGYVSTFGLPISYSTSGSPPAKVLGPSTPSGVNIDPARLGKSAFVPISDVFSVDPPSVNVEKYNLLEILLNLVSGILNLPASIDSCKVEGNLTIDPHPLDLLNPRLNIAVNKPVKIIVDGDLTISGTGQFTIKQNGAVQFFVTGNVKIAGNGIVNQTNDPRKCAIFCTNASTTDPLVYDTTADFCGVIFSEHNPIEIRKNATFYGALLSRQSIRFKDQATSPVFHYDTSLRTATFSGVTTPYIVTQVTEN